jgi:para-nitrobenzyl esterase
LTRQGSTEGAAAICAIPAAHAKNDADDPAIVTESGPLKGVAGARVNAYLGVPYAAPPVGALRWLPPQPFGRWHGVHSAIQAGRQAQSQDASAFPWRTPG